MVVWRQEERVHRLHEVKLAIVPESAGRDDVAEHLVPICKLDWLGLRELDEDAGIPIVVSQQWDGYRQTQAHPAYRQNQRDKARNR